MQRRNFLKKVTVQTLAAATLPAALAASENFEVKSVSLSRPRSAAQESLIKLFTRHLELCKLKRGETLLFYTSPAYAHKEYIAAMLTAAAAMGANAFALEAMPGLEDSDLLLKAFKAANIVYGQIPLYSDIHNAALASGTRTILMTVDVADLERFFPDETVVRRGVAGAERLTRAQTIRITDAAGSDFTLRKKGRKGSHMVGIAAEPGRWDQFPHGSVAAAPIENLSEGIYLVNPGDTIARLGYHVESTVRMTLEKGRITKLEGGKEAEFLRKIIEKEEGYKDPKGRFTDPWSLGHAGWGIDHRADWKLAHLGRDSQMLLGTVMVSIGVNSFDAPSRYSGFKGNNFTRVHIDICCRHKDVYLDGEMILDRNEKFLLPDLA